MGVADDFAPSFTQKPQLRQEDDGNRLIFECQLLASPKPEIEWYRSEELLKDDSRTKFKIQSVGDNKYTVVLDIDDVVETDAGLYKVKAKNKMGEVSASINLNFSREFNFSIFSFFFFNFLEKFQIFKFSKIQIFKFPLNGFFLYISFKKKICNKIIQKFQRRMNRKRGEKIT